MTGRRWSAAPPPGGRGSRGGAPPPTGATGPRSGGAGACAFGGAQRPGLPRVGWDAQGDFFETADLWSETRQRGAACVRCLELAAAPDEARADAVAADVRRALDSAGRSAEVPAI